MHRIGMMQGRLLPKVDGRIQSFPGSRWPEEFSHLAELGYGAIELTIEIASWHTHPIRSKAGRAEIAAQGRATGIFIAGLCADTLMEYPFVSPDAVIAVEGENILHAMLEDCAELGLPMLEVPLMGKASLLQDGGRARFDAVMARALPRTEVLGVPIILESDLPPRELAKLMNEYDHPNLGINYDMGNSTWFGYDPNGELPLYHRRVRNVHVKDCTVENYSVPLGQGDTRFDIVFHQLRHARYRGDFILQAARQPDDLNAARNYLAFIKPFVALLEQ